VPEINGIHDGRQILVPVVLAGGVGQTVNLVEATALLDTGATLTAIAPQLADSMGLVPVGRRILDTAAGTRRANAYNFTLGFRLPHQDGMAQSPLFLPNELYGIDFTKGIAFDVLIGMDVLSKGEFQMDSKFRWVFRF
jgi:predicted aspartyl protease